MNKLTLALGGIAATIVGLVVWTNFDSAVDAAEAVSARKSDVSTVAPPEIDAITRASGEHMVSRADELSPQTHLEKTVQRQTQPLARVPMSYEHHKLNEGAEGKDFDLHAMLEAEPKDTAWAYDVEHRLRDLYERTGAQIYSLECRTVLCELQAFTDDPESSALVQETTRQIDFRELTHMGFSFPIGERQTHLYYFTRVRHDDLK